MINKIAKEWGKSNLNDKIMAVVVLVLATTAIACVTLVADIYLDRKIEDKQVTKLADSQVKTAVLITNFGNIEISLNEKNKITRDNFVSLVRRNFYSGLLVHRVVKGFAIQMGDPTTKDPTKMAHWGDGDPGYNIEREINQDDLITRGTVVMADKDDRSNGSQFLIIVSDAKWLTGHNSILGTVVSGMEVADAISNLNTGITGIPADKVVLLSVELK